MKLSDFRDDDSRKEPKKSDREKPIKENSEKDRRESVL